MHYKEDGHLSPGLFNVLPFYLYNVLSRLRRPSKRNRNLSFLIPALCRSTAVVWNESKKAIIALLPLLVSTLCLPRRAATLNGSGQVPVH